jgi:hypothetical protein
LSDQGVIRFSTEWNFLDITVLGLSNSTVLQEYETSDDEAATPFILLPDSSIVSSTQLPA